MSFLLLGLALFSQHLLPQCVCNFPERHPGDLVMDNLIGTDEPIGVKGEWRDHVNTSARANVEKRENATTKKFATDINATPPDWYPLTPEEIPYLAVLYRRDHGASESYKKLFPGENDPGESHVEPGTACGGALLTTRFVLSVCGCLMSLTANIQGVKSPAKQNNTFQNIYDIYDSKGQYRKIFMTHSLVRFAPDFKYEVDHDRTKWPQHEALNCKGLLVKLGDGDWNRGIRDDGKKAAVMNSHLVLVPVKPEVHPDSTTFSPQWPPHPVNDKVDPGFLRHVQIISIGMRFSRPPSKQFFSSISASTVEMKHCNGEPKHSKLTLTCNKTRVALGRNYTCFCPISVVYNLHGGTIGWPIVQHDKLVGLTASGRDPNNGFVAAAVLSDDYITLIQDYIGKDVLTDQNTPAPVYRQKDLGKNFFIYDYDAFRSQFRNGPDSKATTDQPGLFVILIACIAWIRTTSEPQ